MRRREPESVRLKMCAGKPSSKLNEKRGRWRGRGGGVSWDRPSLVLRPFTVKRIQLQSHGRIWVREEDGSTSIHGVAALLVV